MRAVPITVAEANAYVQHFHRHNGSLPTARMATAAIDEQTGAVHGVAIAGAPKARMAQRPGVLEVSRVCTDGTFNCCSFLYASIARAAKALGYWRLITYTLESEPGSSLKASGWARETDVRSDLGWASRHPRSGSNEHDTGAKVRWAMTFGVEPPALMWPVEMTEPRRAQLTLLAVSESAGL